MIMCKVWDILSHLAIIEKSGWIQVYRVSSLISLSQFTRAPRVQYLGTILNKFRPADIFVKWEDEDSGNKEFVKVNRKDCGGK